MHFGAQMLVLALAPASYRREQRGALARAIYLATAPLLPGFTALSALLGLVVIRIVLATALSYGLSRYALDVLVRTLVLELIPLSAALFVAVRYALAAGKRLRAVPAAAAAIWPSAMAAAFAVITLATVSSIVTLVLAYLSVYGFSTWGLAGFTRTVGQIFNPVIGLIFVMKTLFLSLAVSIIPLVGMPRERASNEFARLARLLAVVLLGEVASLVGNYY